VKHAAAVGIAGLVLLSFPSSARSDRPDAIAGVISIGAVSGIACWITAMAGDDDDQAEKAKLEYARPGWLVAVGGSYAVDQSEGGVKSDVQDAVPFAVDSLSLKNSFGFNGHVGYRCHSRVSAEVEVEWLDGFNGTAFQDGAGKIYSANIEPVVVTTNLKGFLMTGRYQPFLQVGAGVMTAETKLRNLTVSGSESNRTTEFAMRFGGGLEFYATKHIVLTLDTDYVLPFGDLENLDYVTIGWGLQYRF
jgi:opacity protein-like surface antigen